MLTSQGFNSPKLRLTGSLRVGPAMFTISFSSLKNPARMKLYFFLLRDGMTERRADGGSPGALLHGPVSGPSRLSPRGQM